MEFNIRSEKRTENILHNKILIPTFFASEFVGLVAKSIDEWGFVALAVVSLSDRFLEHQARNLVVSFQVSEFGSEPW